MNEIKNDLKTEEYVILKILEKRLFSKLYIVIKDEK